MFASSVAFQTMPGLPAHSGVVVNDTFSGVRVRELLVSEMDQAGFSQRQIRDVELAFTEALVNALRHGNQDDPHNVVRIQYRIDAAGLWLRIEDEGGGFQLDQVGDLTLPENLDRPGGRGLLLMKSLMSHIELNARGNQVVMRLLRSAA